MAIERLKRVIWRLQQRDQVGENLVIKRKELRLAIMKECGTDERTIAANIKALKELKWLRKWGRNFKIGEDYSA